MKDIKALSRLLDSRFQVGSFRFGMDGLIGLIPVVGDLTTGVASLYIVGRAYGLGLPGIVLVKMLLNILIETIIGSVPILGNIFDFIWKSNQKNIELIEDYQKSASQVKSRSQWSVFVFSLTLLAALFSLAYLFLKFLTYLVELF